MRDQLAISFKDVSCPRPRNIRTIHYKAGVPAPATSSIRKGQVADKSTIKFN